MAYWNPNLISMLYYYTGWIAVLIICITLILKFCRRNKPFELIPGPKGHFLLGNTLDFSISTDHHALLLKWARKYGSVFKYYILFGKRSFSFFFSLFLLLCVSWAFDPRNCSKGSTLYLAGWISGNPKKFGCGDRVLYESR